MRFSIDNTPDGFYIYAYIREDGTPYYIGKGSGQRAWRAHHKIVNNRFSGIPLPSVERIVILESNLSDIGALALERRYIRWFGRKDNNTGILRNRTDGGEGGNGVVNSEETRRRKSEANKGQGAGRKLSEATKQKLRNRTYSPEVRAKMGAPKGTVPSEETRKKISQAKKGKPNIKNRGRVMTKEEIQHRTDARTNNGKPWFTEQARKNISEGNKRRAAERKAAKLAQQNENFSTLFILE